jgi:hypothetical protein
MILHYERVQRYPVVFKALTGLRVPQFDELVADVLPRYPAAAHARLNRPTRKRAIGAGHPFELDPRHQLLLTVIWLRVYPIPEVLASLFGGSATTVGRVIARVLPRLEASGRDTMRMPDPGKKRRRRWEALLAATPALAGVLDTLEQRGQRHPARKTADAYYSGKKKQHPLKRHVAVDEEPGQIVEGAASGPGPPAAIKLLAQSKLLERLPAGGAGAGLWRMSGSTNSTPVAWALPRAARRAAKPAHRRRSATIGPSRGDGSWWNIGADTCGGIKR